MATISINIPDGKLTEVVDILCAYGGYVSGNKNQFARGIVLADVKRICYAYYAGVRQNAQAGDIQGDVDSLSIT